MIWKFKTMLCDKYSEQKDSNNKKSLLYNYYSWFDRDTLTIAALCTQGGLLRLEMVALQLLYMCECSNTCGWACPRCQLICSIWCKILACSTHNCPLCFSNSFKYPCIFWSCYSHIIASFEFIHISIFLCRILEISNKPRLFSENRALSMFSIRDSFAYILLWIWVFYSVEHWSHVVRLYLEKLFVFVFWYIIIYYSAKSSINDCSF